MQSLSRVSVAARVAMIVALGLAAVAAVTATSLFSLRESGATALRVIDVELDAVKRLGDTRAMVGNMRRYEKDMFLNLGDEKSFDGYLVKWRKEVDAGAQAMRDSAAVLPPADRARLEAMQGGLARYRSGFEGLIRKIGTGELNDPWAANKAMEPLKGDIRSMDVALNELGSSIEQRVQQERADIVAMNRRQLLLGAATTLGAAIALGLLAWGISRSITRPLAEAVQALDRVAGGDLTQEIRVDGSDELARMLRQVAAMQKALSGIALAIQQGAGHVASASEQIAQGNQDLSGRTESQAAGLQQTASSMEQLTDTVRRSADHAREAHTLAGGASAVAVRGGEVVAQVVDKMSEIQGSSRRIAEITGVIDAIAFQTNILALNAAVEAARAGEQGRGFAVVAGEVRTLAQRCAQAAREIKALIGASVDSVESGGALVQAAGATMQEVVAQVQAVSERIGAITAAADEQQRGIEQVGLAVTQLDRSTQQNAALVEESAAAAASLKAQAGRLAEVASVFRVAPQAPA